MNKSIKHYPETNILDNFYTAVKDNNLDSIYLYHSDIHYIRAALQELTGKTFSLAKIESEVVRLNK